MFIKVKCRRGNEMLINSSHIIAINRTLGALYLSSGPRDINCISISLQELDVIEMILHSNDMLLKMDAIKVQEFLNHQEACRKAKERNEERRMKLNL